MYSTDQSVEEMIDPRVSNLVARYLGDIRVSLEVRAVIETIVTEMFVTNDDLSAMSRIHTETTQKLKETAQKLKESLERNQELCMMQLTRAKEDIETGFRVAGEELRSGLRTMCQVVEVRFTSSRIVVPLARHFPDWNISQTNDGEGCISWPVEGPDDEYELCILVSFKKIDGLTMVPEVFVVKHDVEGLELHGWPQEGREASTEGEMLNLVNQLLGELPDPAIDFICKEERALDEVRVDNLLKSTTPPPDHST